MGLETGSYIDDLVTTNPTSTDLVKFGDDHLRLLKVVLKNCFPNIDGAVNPTPAELNYLVGVTSLVQDQLDAKLAIATADGAGLTEAGGILAVGAGNGLEATADEVLFDLDAMTAIEGNALNSAEDSFVVDDNGTAKKMTFQGSGFVVQTEAGATKTIAGADLNQIIRFTAAGGCVVTLNNAIGVVGNWMTWLQYGGATAVTRAGTATVNGANGTGTSGAQYSGVTYLCVAANTWIVLGDAA